jgi:hypothetical protein
VKLKVGSIQWNCIPLNVTSLSSARLFVKMSRGQDHGSRFSAGAENYLRICAVCGYVTPAKPQ